MSCLSTCSLGYNLKVPFLTARPFPWSTTLEMAGTASSASLRSLALVYLLVPGSSQGQTGSVLWT